MHSTIFLELKASRKEGRSSNQWTRQPWARRRASKYLRVNKCVKSRCFLNLNRLLPPPSSHSRSREQNRIFRHNPLCHPHKCNLSRLLRHHQSHQRLLPRTITSHEQLNLQFPNQNEKKITRTTNGNFEAEALRNGDGEALRLIAATQWIGVFLNSCRIVLISSLYFVQPGYG